MRLCLEIVLTLTVFSSSAYSYKAFIDAIKDNFTPAAQNEFNVVVDLAVKKPGKVGFSYVLIVPYLFV